MNFLRGIIGAIVALALTGFALLNRHNVMVYFSPLHDPWPLPLYLITLGLLGLGFVCGGGLVWLNMSPIRRAKRTQRKIIHALEKELETARTKIPPPKPFA